MAEQTTTHGRALAATRGQALAGHLDIDQLSAFLNQHGVEHEVIEHSPTVRAAESARASAVPPDAAAKTVVLYDHGALLLAALPASEMVDMRKVRDLLGASRSLRLATEQEIASHFPEFEVGAVPPVGGGGVFASRLVDRHLLDQPRVLCGSADHRHAVLLDPRELTRLGNAVVADICEE